MDLVFPVPMFDDAELVSWRVRVAELEAENAWLAAESSGLRAENVELSGRLAELAEQVRKLTEMAATLTGLLFGVSSEKTKAAGLGTTGPDDGDHPDGGGEGNPAARGKRGQRPGGRGHGRRDLSHLETEERVIEVDPGERACGGCGTAFTFLGTEDSEQLGWVVRIVRVVWRRSRYKRACSCPGPRTVCARPADKPVPKGLFTAGFLARLLYQKYVLGLPVHRIVKALSAEGLELPEGTVAGALKQVVPLVRPLATAIASHGAVAGHVHADETGWKVFADTGDGKDGHQQWLWVFVTVDTVVFVMDPTRSARVAADHLGIDREQGALEAGRRLVISSDFHRAYQSLARIDGVDPLWCWAHIRRYFLRAGAAHPDALGAWCEQWISRIAVLYRAHTQLGETVPGSVEYEQATGRYQRSFTDLDTYRQLQSDAAGKNLLHPAAAKVIATLNNEWEGLARHEQLPSLPLDNNTAERALRTPVIGRKNFYGSNAVWAADLAADIWTITATAQKNNLEPLDYLSDYLQACARQGGTAPVGADLDAFLP